MREKVEAVIANTLRPVIEADGGQIELVSVDASVVVVRLTGMCAGCPGSAYTISRVIQPILQKAVGTSATIRVEIGPSDKTPAN